jgi:hypothetical protein
MKIKCNCGKKIEIENIEIEKIKKKEPVKIACTSCKNVMVIDDTKPLYKKYITLLVLDVFFMLSIILGAILLVVTLKFSWTLIFLYICLTSALFSLWGKKIALRIIGSSLIVLIAILFIWRMAPKYTRYISIPEKIFDYEINNDGVIIINYKGESEKVVVPKKIKRLPVTAIGEGAFKGSSAIHTVDMVAQQNNISRPVVSPALYKELRNNRITSIVLPDTIETIGDNAFEYTTSLTNIAIPNSVKTIGNRAFSNSGLIELNIPDSVESIGPGAFENNNLTSVVIPVSIKVIEQYTFNGNQLTNIVIPDSVETISKMAFGNNKLTSIIIPNSVISIGDNAFENNSLTSIFIPESVLTIGSGAFENNQIISITISDNVDLGTRVFDVETGRQRMESGAYSLTINSNITNTVNNHYMRNGKKMKIFNFLTIDDFDIVIIDESFVEIQKYNGSRNNIVLPEKISNLPVFSIGAGAFSNKQITDIVIPNTIKEIGASAFRTNQLKNITIPLSVQTIGYAAFADNPLTRIVKPNNIVVDATSFYSNSELKKYEEERKNQSKENLLRKLTGIQTGEIPEKIIDDLTTGLMGKMMMGQMDNDEFGLMIELMLLKKSDSANTE